MRSLVWAVVILGVGAAWSVLAGRWPRAALGGSLVAILVSAVLAVASAIAALGGAPAAPVGITWPMPLGNVVLLVGMDGLSAWFILTTGVLSACVAIYSWGYLHGELRPGPIRAYGFFLSLLVAALLVVFAAGDVALFLTGWEVMALAGFFLVIFHDKEAESRRGAWIYLIALHIGTAVFVLPMFGVLVARAGSTQFSAFATALASIAPVTAGLLFVLGLIGFGTKAGFMPMHVWLPHAHPAAPSPVSALLSGVVIKSGIYGLLRLLSWLPPLPAWCGMVMLVVAVISGVMGVLYALGQHQIKRLLAYHSVENIGIIGIGIGVGMLGQTSGLSAVAVLGYAGALLHVLNHAVFKGLLFLSAGGVIHATGSAEIDQLGGLAKKTPLNALLFLMAALSICGLPAFNGFISEWLVYNGLFRGAWSGEAWAWSSVLGLTALALIGGLALACFAKVFSIVFLGEARDPRLPGHRTPVTMLIGMAPLAAICLVIGLGAAAFAPWMWQAVSPLMAQATSGDAAGEALRPLGQIIPVLGIFVAVVAGLAILRWRLPATRQTVAGEPTWGCGYAYPHPRMQYTGSSFAWSLVEAFSAVLRPRRQVHRPMGYFPTGGSLHTDTPDAAENWAFAPMFRGIAAGFQRLWPLQHGRIQLYLIYIVGTLLLVFAVEAIWMPLSKAPLEQTPTPTLSRSPGRGAMEGGSRRDAAMLKVEGVAP